MGETTGIYLGAAAGEALAHGNDTAHVESVVNDLPLISGNNTTIKGARAKASAVPVLVNIGGNLDIESE